jgi:GT2 family glycosyltransferase
MQYLQVHIEVTGPIPAVYVPRGYRGIGCYLKRNGRPVGFFLQRVPEGTTLQPRDLGRWVLEKSGVELVWSSIRENHAYPELPHQTFSLSVAICTKDRPDNVSRCLASLVPVQMSAQGTREFDVLIVDNAPSDDRTERIVASLPSVRYVMEPRPGLDFARNLAIRETSAEFLAYLDDDVTVDATWFEGLERAITENPDAGAFTGSVLPLELLSEAQILFQSRSGFHHGFTAVRYGPQSILSRNFPCNAGMFGAGCNMIFRRALLIDLGGFDEALDTGRPLPGGGDLDIFYRVLRSGNPLVYDGGAVVYHQHRREYNQLRHQMWTWGLGVMAFHMKCYKYDVAYRAKLRRSMLGWVSHMTRMILLTAAHKNSHDWSTDLSITELAGGMVGIAGEYGRSVRRTERIRRLHDGTHTNSM